MLFSMSEVLDMRSASIANLPTQQQRQESYRHSSQSRSNDCGHIHFPWRVSATQSDREYHIERKHSWPTGNSDSTKPNRQHTGDSHRIARLRNNGVISALGLGEIQRETGYISVLVQMHLGQGVPAKSNEWRRANNVLSFDYTPKTAVDGLTGVFPKIQHRFIPLASPIAFEVSQDVPILLMCILCVVGGRPTCFQPHQFLLGFLESFRLLRCKGSTIRLVGLVAVCYLRCSRLIPSTWISPGSVQDD